jgi:DNA-binding response OmpR family regulator
MALLKFLSKFSISLFHKKTNKKKILLVDDDKICLKCTLLILKELDFDIFIADNGTDAIEIIKNIHFDFVLLDLGLPDINGLKVLKKINIKNNNFTKVIVITSYNQDYMKIACKKLNAHAFIQKPINFEKLINAINL